MPLSACLLCWFVLTTTHPPTHPPSSPPTETFTAASWASSRFPGLRLRMKGCGCMGLVFLST